MEQLMNLSELNMVSEVELVYKNKVKPSERPLVKSPKECHELLKLTWDENKIEFVEQFKVVLMNRAQRVLGIYELSTGGVDGTVTESSSILSSSIHLFLNREPDYRYTKSQILCPSAFTSP
jgi:DNA repair protein RadC